ncbi:hypothetical protein [Nocardiopsis sp. LOL_012]|uniref:hypothetical protein n=1 Tax=Nocardiopsis sp. LOL_012 TaxID=3345409 RepID=UPI003A87431C
MRKPFAGAGSPFSSASSVDAWTAEADVVSLPRLDEIGALTRPTNIGTTYAEQEYRALGEEQLASWAAEGEQAARAHVMRARGLERAATVKEMLLVHQEGAVRQARDDYQQAARVLGPDVRREVGAKVRYWVCWPLLVVGDSAGILMSAVAFGDAPSVALGVAVAAGMAAGCSGLIGAEVKHLRNARARQRDPETLSEEEFRFRRLFSGSPDKGLGLVGLVSVVSLLVVALLAVGVFLLRGSLEGAASGLTFGCLAAATALGSFLLGYHAADEVADLLSGYKKRASQAEARLRRLAGDRAIRQRAAADAAARSVYAEHAARGQAAAKRVESLNWRIQRNNPQVLGHGFPAHERTGVGRRVRSESNGYIGNGAR